MNVNLVHFNLIQILWQKAKVWYYIPSVRFSSFVPSRDLNSLNPEWNVKLCMSLKDSTWYKDLPNYVSCLWPCIMKDVPCQPQTARTNTATDRFPDKSVFCNILGNIYGNICGGVFFLVKLRAVCHELNYNIFSPLMYPK